MSAPALAEALEHLVKGIVDHPDQARVSTRESSRGETLEVRVHPNDLGRVIGRGGRTAQALRTVIGSLSNGDRVRIDVIDTAEENGAADHDGADRDAADSLGGAA
ncbi:RNA-binding protein [Leucobacter sp. GX24907]